MIKFNKCQILCGSDAAKDQNARELATAGKRLRPSRARQRYRRPFDMVLVYVVLLCMLVRGAAACTAGEQSTASGCVGCPAGQACDGGSTTTSCAATPGTYSLAGSAACVPCPAGYSCASAAAGPAACAAGSTSASGVSTCSPLAAGSVSPDGITTVDCGANQATKAFYTNTARDRCLPCPPGFACATAGAAPVACAAGHYSLGLQQVCTPCPAGSACPSTSSIPIACPPGTYSLLGSTQAACVTCPAGSRCPTGNSGPVACGPAEYSFAGSSAASCTACPAGHEGAGRAAPLPLCAAGSYALAGAGTCTQCSSGSACPSTIAAPTDASSITGAYAPAGTIIIRDCPVGHYCQLTTATTPCATGTWYGPATTTASRTTCIAVPIGWELPSGALAPIKCPLGYHSTGGAASCSRCLWGQRCPGTGTLETCTSSQLCLPGTFAATAPACPSYMPCSLTSVALTVCSAGTYLDYSAATDTGSCTDCPAGRHCTTPALASTVTTGYYSAAGDSLQHPCPAGFACPGGASATALSPGQYALEGGGTALDCPVGSACPDPAGYSHRLDCTALKGYHADTAGLAACKVCLAGHYCPAGSATASSCASGSFAGPGQGACEPCRPGLACSSATTPASTPCAFGTYSPGGETACLPCPVGHECSPTVAVPCLANHYAELGSGTCWPLPAGVSAVAITGSTVTKTSCSAGSYKLAGPGVCRSCPAGHACPSTALPPSKCPPGTYQGATGHVSCLPCATGSYSTAGQTRCRTCPEGHRCATAASLPVKCHMGTWAGSGATSCSACTDGYLCQSGATTATPTHSLCPAGFYCVHGSNTVTVTPCAAGTYSAQRGAAAASACLPCPAGKYCPLGCSVPLTCTTGAACPESSPSNYATPCPAGQYLDIKGATTLTACKPCPAYYYCPIRTTYPVKCPPGHFCPAGSTEATAHPCPAATYGGLDSLYDQSECTTCPEGHTCGAGSVFPVACGPGTYQPATGAAAPTSCTNCPAGTVCPFYGARHSATAIYCGHGHACPAGTKWLYETPCPAGKYSDDITITSVTQCLPCPARYACPRRSGMLVGALGSNTLTNPKVACAAGHWCPEGSASRTAHPCPAGTYSPATDNYQEADCIACPAGSYCSGGGALPDGPAAAGHYCPIRSSTATAKPCPAGTYQPVTGARARGDCLVCPLGQYCLAASAAATPCAAGTYGRTPGLQAATPSGTTVTGCATCPAGWKCPSAGTIEPATCGLGAYSGPGATSCPACLFDRYCDSIITSETVMNTEKQCGAGYICPVGTPVKPYHVSATYSCQPGSWCASSVSHTCAPGTWQPLVGAGASSACLPVPAGYYATAAGATSYVGNECAIGYYCPAGSTRGTAQPCPAKTFRGLTKGGAAADCGGCPAGRFCPANTRVPFTCPLGYYCLAQTDIPEPCPRGTFGASPGLRALAECSACWGGRYCSQTGLAEPDGLCDAGYYCSEGAFTAAPVDGTTGALCPTGGYCPQGSRMATHCPAGTYNPALGKTTAADCIACTAGSYCAGSSNPTPTGLCQAGYYCPTGLPGTPLANGDPGPLIGSYSPTQEAAEPGYFTQAGAASPSPCAAGDYNPYPAQAACFPCEAGRYCPATGSSSQTDCGAGYWCGARASSRTPCPAGTSSSKTRAGSAADCTACPPGRYCATAALTTPTGDCSPGSFCLSGATKPAYTLAETTTNYGLCPLDHYCGSATSVPTHCGDGKWSAPPRDSTRTIGLATAGECALCPAGEYCQASSVTQPTGLCAEGYYCPAGSSSAAPTATPCPAGSLCPAGSATPTPCPAGSYQPATTKGACIVCSAGHYCLEGATGLTACVTGRYCPEATGAEAGITCPIGTYSSRGSRTAAIDCLPCDPGSYCQSAGQDAVTGACQAGYYCTVASFTATPGGSLPSGYQTIYPVTSPGGRCPTGSYCPAGSPIAVPCPAGYFCSAAEMTVAQMLASPCTAGHTCGVGLSAAGPACLAGHYCPLGSSAGAPCPLGTYNPSTGASTSAACLACPATKYCATPALSAPTGTCAAGYVCAGGASTATPAGGLCAAGFACPAGAAAAIPCDGSTAATDYQDERGQASCKTCPAGYWCTDIAIARCSPASKAESFYCPASTRAKVACSAGTINHVDGSASASDCHPCPPGSYCPTSGFTDSVGTKTKSAACPAGSYCTGGVAVPAICPIGFYCPLGTNLPIPCHAGSHCATTGLSLPTGPCAAGWYCTYETISTTSPVYSALPHCAGLATCVRGATSAQSTVCTAGSYCPAGAHTPTECPIGTSLATTGASVAASCVACPAGAKCPHRGMSAPGPSCQAGYYCPAGSATDTEYQCPAGSRCPPGSAAHSPCAPGSYQPFELQSACLTCPAGRYCPTSRATRATLCPAGYHCAAGTSVDVPASTSATYACPAGYESALVGLKTASDCQLCTEGKYCTAPASVTYTSACAAGYYCYADVPSTVAEPPGRRCQAGQYCAQGAIRPSECPPGTAGAPDASLPVPAGGGTPLRTSTAACSPCPAGRYCPAYGLVDGASGASAIGTCPSGYLCLSGARHPADLDNNTISLCPAGSYCAATRAAVEGASLCPLGTYQPLAGQVSCLSCPAGFECEEAGATAPRSCAKGHYCPAPASDEALTAAALVAAAATPTSNRQPCPARTYGPTAWLKGASECLPCLPGYYCSGPSATDGRGRSAVDGPCAAGYVCVGGASSDSPSASGGVADATTNGPCPAGHSCPAGTPYPVPCPPGRYQPATGQSACSACPAGKYCPTPGGASAASLPACADGFHCVQGANNSMPTDGSTGRLCAVAHFCVGGLEAACPAGSYGPRAGLSVCPTCPAGYFCEAQASAPTPCPNSRYCPAGSAAGVPCPAGTYTPSSLVGLDSAAQCLPCPTGKYCRGGESEASGVCPAGAFCISGASGPIQTPGGALPDYTNPAGFPVCPAGFYCEAGTLLPTACPAGTYSAAGSVREVPDCGLCEAGYYCRNGTRQELVCPAGHYCEAGASEPTPCPRTTYRTKTGAQRLSQCRDCRAGLMCDETGISDLLNYACAPGHYCPKGTLELLPCPVGTYAAYPSGRGLGDCQACLSGFYCPSLATVTPLLCSNGTYCPGGDSAPIVCPSGSYCPAGSSSPIPCAAGFYCEGGSEYFLKCQNGTYCPFGSSYPVACPGGSFGSGNPQNVGFSSGCLPCGRGAFSTSAYNIECLDCLPGYVCLGRTNSQTPTSRTLHRGYRCPKGHHCPAASYVETPCPQGTYSKNAGATGSFACLRCKVGWYGDLVGQAGCKKCGPSASTPAAGGATTCTCVGAHRRFIKSSGSCLCEAGYKPKNRGDPAADAASDCELIVKEACAVGVEVDVEGNCVTDTSTLCSSQCPQSSRGQTGALVAGTGLCQCPVVQDVETVCDARCRATQVVTTLEAGGKLTLRDPTTGAVASYDPSEVPGYGGVPTCRTGGSCKMLSLGRAADGAFTADYGTNARLLAHAGLHSNFVAHVDLASTNAKRRRALESGRLLQTAADSGEAIRNPVTCVNTGAVVLFDVDAEEGRYPVYVKNSILNTNQDFDRAPFDELATLVENGVQVRTWAAEFAEKGIYVFADSKDASKLTVVAVKAATEACKDPDANIQSMTAASLSAVGIESQAKSVQPNWSFIIGTFVVLLGFNFGLVGAFVYLRNRASMKLTSGQGDGATIYYDKVADQEAKDRERRSCRACCMFYCCCGGAGWRQSAKEKKSQKESGPNYRDLVQLLEDFKQEYSVLQEQLKDDSEAQKREQDQADGQSKREEGLLDERIAALQELKDFVRENQDCLREYLGIKDGDSGMEQDTQREGEKPITDDHKKNDEGQRLIAQSQKQEEEFAKQWEEGSKSNQEAIFAAELDESDRLRQAAMDEFKQKIANNQMAGEDSQILLGEIQGKLGSIDALIQGEEEQQNKLLREALDRRRKRRAGLQEKAKHLEEKKEAQDEKYGRKLRAIKEQEQAQLHNVEAEIEREREQGLLEVDQQIMTDKEKKLAKLQKELRAFNKRSAGAQGELAFSEKLSEYKDQVAGVEAQAEAERNRKRLALEEKLRKRRAARIKDVEDATKEQEVTLIEEMQQKNQAAAQELEAVQALLQPVFEEEQRLESVAKHMAMKRVAAAQEQVDNTDGAAMVDQGPDKASSSLIGGKGEKEDPEIAELYAQAEANRQVEDEKVQGIQDQLQQEAQKTAAAAAKTEERRRELKKRLENAEDDGEKRRLLNQLDQVNKDWEDRLAQENDAQHKRLKAALEERRRARKKAKDDVANKKEEKLVEAASASLADVLHADEAAAEEGGRLLVAAIEEEFVPADAVQATESYLDKAHQQELLDLMNSMFTARSKVLKKMLFEMMTQKQGEYELIGAEFEPQYAFLKEKKSKGLIAANDYKSRLEKLSEEESDRKMDIEIEYGEREQRLQDEVERLRLKKEASLKGELKQKQHIERRTALQELRRLHADQSTMAKYLKDQEKTVEKELRQFQKQTDKDKEEKLAAIEEARRTRIHEIKEKEQAMLNWEGDAKSQEEKHLAQFEKQRDAILKQKQMEQQRELTHGLSKEEAAKLLQRHQEDTRRLEGALADESRRQMVAMRARLANRNKDAAAQRVQRQIKMAAVQKRKAQYRASAEALSGFDDEHAVESKEALAKCLSKAGHMKRLIFKGGFSQQPEQRRRVVERTLELEKRLGGEDPLAAVLDGLDLDEYRSSRDDGPQASARLTARQSQVSDDTIVLTEHSNMPIRDSVTFKELFDHVERIERDYQEVAGSTKETRPRQGAMSTINSSSTGTLGARAQRRSSIAQPPGQRASEGSVLSPSQQSSAKYSSPRTGASGAPDPALSTISRSPTGKR